MSQSIGQLHTPGLQEPFLRRMATFPVTLAAIPFKLLKQWIARTIPSVWLTSLRGLGNLWASVAATFTNGISMYGLSPLSRPPALNSPEPPPTKMMILSRLIDDFHGQQFVRRISHQASFDHHRPDARQRRSQIRTFEIYDLEYRLVFRTVQGQRPLVQGVQVRPRLSLGRIQLKRSSGESRLRFMTDEQFIYGASEEMTVDHYARQGSGYLIAAD